MSYRRVTKDSHLVDTANELSCDTMHFKTHRENQILVFSLKFMEVDLFGLGENALLFVWIGLWSIEQKGILIH